jgi:hypothetical protein
MPVLKICPLLFLLLSISCTQLKTESVYGSYEAVNKDSMMSSKLILKDNFRFDYAFQGDLTSSSATGTWKIKGKSIRLNSYYKKPKKAMIVKEHTNDSLIGWEVKVFDIITHQPVDVCRVIINNNSVVTNSQGLAYFKKSMTFDKTKRADIITLHYPFHTFTYHIKHQKSNTFIILLDDNQNIHTFFKNYRLKVKQDKLVRKKWQFIKQ